MTNQQLKPYLQPAFLTCAIVLFIAAAGMSVVTSALKVSFIKLPLPLRQSLDTIDDNALAPYKLVEKSKIPKEIIEELGTEDYIQWLLEDESVDKSSPARFCSLFITFYTGTPDQVPHVPEECYTGGGKGQAQTPDDEILTAVLNGKTVKVPVRMLRFVKDEDVTYFFKVNGQYASSREPARRVLQTNFKSKYSYFSKVEWKFFNRSASGYIYPGKKDLTDASQRLLNKLLPVLENTHWPDWEQANQKKD